MRYYSQLNNLKELKVGEPKTFSDFKFNADFYKSKEALIRQHSLIDNSKVYLVDIDYNDDTKEAIISLLQEPVTKRELLMGSTDATDIYIELLKGFILNPTTVTEERLMTIKYSSGITSSSFNKLLIALIKNKLLILKVVNARINGSEFRSILAKASMKKVHESGYALSQVQKYKNRRKAFKKIGFKTE